MKAGSMTSQGSYTFKILIIYAISLVISILIITISTTLFLVIVYISGSVSGTFFYLFVAIIASNIAVSAFSIRGLARIYPSLISEPDQKTQPLLNEALRKNPQQNSGRTELKREYFSDAELEIIDLLKKSGNRMLQSSIVAASAMSKTTISRTITSLEGKGIIVKMRKGVTNEIILNETYSR